MFALKPVLMSCLVALSVLCSPQAEAQCSGLWLPCSPIPGADNRVGALLEWDADGPGPLPSVLVAAGDFRAITDQTANGVAAWDGSTWSPLGSGLGSAVTSLAALPTGTLVAATRPAINWRAGVYFWTGSAWAHLDRGLAPSNGYVSSLLVLANGDLIASGRFTSIDGVTAANIARWNGMTWSSLGSGIASADVSQIDVNALAQLPGGELVAGGKFSVAGGIPVSSLAIWNGSEWYPLGSGVNGTVNSLAVMTNGDLAVRGIFSAAGNIPSNGLARWNGVAWSDFAPGSAPQNALASGGLAALPGNRLLVGGAFTTPAAETARGIALWDGTAWASLDSGLDSNADAILLRSNGEIVAGGGFRHAGAVPAFAIARWQQSQWRSFARGIDAQVNALLSLPNGDVVVGGQFTTIPGGSAQRIARWSNGSMTPLGSGVDGAVFALAALPNGDVIAGGAFQNAGGAPAANIARWDGSEWHPLADGLDGDVQALVIMPNGDLIAGGWFQNSGSTPLLKIARWNGQAWSAVGGGMDQFGVYALAALPNGDLVAGGSFNMAGGTFIYKIARWNGATWSALGPGLSSLVTSLAVEPNGNIIAAGSFTRVHNGSLELNNVGRWNGTSWSALGGGSFSQSAASLVLPDGSILVGTGGGVQRWDGSSWTFVARTNEGSTSSRPVTALALTPSGDLFAGGTFSVIDRVASSNVAFRKAPTRAGSPVIVAQPTSSRVCRPPFVLTLRTSALSPTGSALTFRWLRNGISISNVQDSIEGVSTPSLTLTSSALNPADISGSYQVQVTSVEGCALSDAAIVTVCKADFNCSGTLEVQDIFDFLNAFLAGDASADATANNVIDSGDIFRFIGDWFHGCSQ